MGANVFTEENLACLLVGVMSTDAQKKPEILTEVLKELGLIVKPQGPSSLE